MLVRVMALVHDTLFQRAIPTSEVLSKYLKKFLAPLAEVQRAIVMPLCPSCGRPSVPSKNFSSETTD